MPSGIASKRKPLGNDVADGDQRGDRDVRDVPRVVSIAACWVMNPSFLAEATAVGVNIASAMTRHAKIVGLLVLPPRGRGYFRPIRLGWSPRPSVRGVVCWA